MTQSTRTPCALRTVAEIASGIAFIDKSILDTEAFLRDLREALDNSASTGRLVIGFPQYGWYMNGKGTLGGVLWAERHVNRSHLMGMRVVNGKGEVAVVVTYGEALRLAISQQEDLVTQLWGMRRDACDELAATVVADEAAKADADAEAYAVEQDYYGMAEERRRHP